MARTMEDRKMMTRSSSLKSGKKPSNKKPSQILKKRIAKPPTPHPAAIVKAKPTPKVVGKISVSSSSSTKKKTPTPTPLPIKSKVSTPRPTPSVTVPQPVVVAPVAAAAQTVQKKCIWTESSMKSKNKKKTKIVLKNKKPQLKTVSDESDSSDIEFNNPVVKSSSVLSTPEKINNKKSPSVPKIPTINSSLLAKAIKLTQARKRTDSSKALSSAKPTGSNHQSREAIISGKSSVSSTKSSTDKQDNDSDDLSESPIVPIRLGKPISKKSKSLSNDSDNILKKKKKIKKILVKTSLLKKKKQHSQSNQSDQPHSLCEDYHEAAGSSVHATKNVLAQKEPTTTFSFAFNQNPSKTTPATTLPASSSSSSSSWMPTLSQYTSNPSMAASLIKPSNPIIDLRTVFPPPAESNSFKQSSTSSAQLPYLKSSNDTIAFLQRIIDDETKTSYKREIDIVFCVDTTSSMGEYLHATIDQIAAIYKKAQPFSQIIDLKFGFVCYRDHHPEETTYLYRLSNLGSALQTIQFIQKQEAAGGGDTPEAVMDGLYVATAGINWRTKSRKYIIHIADAPPHGDIYTGVKGGFLQRSFVWHDGCPCGLSIEKIARIMNNLHIHYRLIRAGDNMSRMASIFKSCIKHYADIKVSSPEGLDFILCDMISKQCLNKEDIQEEYQQKRYQHKETPESDRKRRQLQQLQQKHLGDYNSYLRGKVIQDSRQQQQPSVILRKNNIFEDNKDSDE